MAPTLDPRKWAYVIPSPVMDLPSRSKHFKTKLLRDAQEFTRPLFLHISEYKTFLRDFWDTQTQTFENRGQGWIFWTWKAAVSPTKARLRWDRYSLR